MIHWLATMTLSGPRPATEAQIKMEVGKNYTSGNPRYGEWWIKFPHFYLATSIIRARHEPAVVVHVL